MPFVSDMTNFSLINMRHCQVRANVSPRLHRLTCAGNSESPHGNFGRSEDDTLRTAGREDLMQLWAGQSALLSRHSGSKLLKWGFSAVGIYFDSEAISDSFPLSLPPAYRYTPI